MVYKMTTNSKIQSLLDVQSDSFKRLSVTNSKRIVLYNHFGSREKTLEILKNMIHIYNVFCNNNNLNQAKSYCVVYASSIIAEQYFDFVKELKYFFQCIDVIILPQSFVSTHAIGHKKEILDYYNNGKLPHYYIEAIEAYALKCVRCYRYFCNDLESADKIDSELCLRCDNQVHKNIEEQRYFS